MLRRHLIPLIVLCSSCSPAPAPPPQVAAKPKPVEPAPALPPPSGVKWIFPEVGGTVRSELDLGDKGALQVGEHGRRWWIAKDGKISQPTDVAPEDLVDARVENGGFLFLGEAGGVFLAKDPVGKIETIRPGPTAAHAVFRAGQKALIGVDADGMLHRSTDAGATWNTTKLPLRKGETIASLAANRKGHAMVVLRPQRVLVSTDDGATWNAIATPGIGARDALRDRNDDLFVRGAFSTKFAKLAVDPTARLATPSTPAKFTERTAPKSDEFVETSRTLAGERVVTVTETELDKGTRKSIAISIAPLGSGAATPSMFVKDAPIATRLHVAGYQSTVVVASLDPDAEDAAWHLKRTNDDGKTWEDLGEAKVGEEPGLELLVGPAWVMLDTNCAEEGGFYAPPSTKPCARPKLKLGSKPFQEVELPAGIELHEAIFDPARNRVFVVGTETSGELTIFTGKPDDTKLTALDIELPMYRPDAIAVDGQGTLRMIYGRELHRFDASLAQKPTLHLPFAPYEVTLFGDRGFAHANDQGWESNDGGEHWAKVPAGAGGTLKCASAGCVASDIVRAGWELPNPKLELVASTHKPPKKEAVAPKTSPAPVALSCTPKGAWTKSPGSTYSFVPALDGDVRFLAVSQKNDGSHVISVARGAAPPKAITVLGPAPTPKKAPPPAQPDPKNPKSAPKMEASAPAPRIRSASELDAHGYVAARFTFSLESKGEAKYNPVDVDLGWYSAASGKTGKARIPQVPAFRVASFGKSALVSIVEGGVLFLPNNGTAPLYRVKDDGKVTALTRPPTIDNVPYTSAIEVGGTVYLVAIRSEDVALAWSADGKTWKTTAWTTGGLQALASIDGKARLALSMRINYSRALPKMLLGLDPIGNDPGEPIMVDAGGRNIGAQGLVACTAKTRTGLRADVDHAKGDRSVKIDVEGDKGWVKGNEQLLAPVTLEGRSHVIRTAADGSSCIDAVTGTPGKADLTALVFPHDLAHGWLIRRGKEAKDGPVVEARPIACTAAK